MRIKLTSIVELVIPTAITLLLVGCLAGGSGGGLTYDGTWTVLYADSGFSAGSGVVCAPSPLATVKLVNGAGSTIQTDNCIPATPVASYTYVISVAISTSTGVVNAIVNGVPLTGSCISSVGCSAQSGTKALSLTR